MAAENQASGDGGKLDKILAALQTSYNKTVKYLMGTAIFYIVLIIVFAILLTTAEKPEERGANFGILILVSLGFLGMGISLLRGLKGSGVGIGGFFNLFHLPLKEKLGKLKDAGGWSVPDERQRAAEELLEHQAAAEKEMRAWPNRLLSLAVITAIDLIMWLAWDAWLMALINQGIAMVVSQTHITMAPTASLKALASLQSS